MNETITDKEIIERLPEEDKLRFQRLLGQEELAKALGKEVPEDVKDKLNRYRSIDYREAWKLKIDIDDSTKEKIIEAADKIPVKETVDEEGSRLIEFKLGYIKYKILDPRLENHTDKEYRQHHSDNSITKIDRDYVLQKGMNGKNHWYNRKLSTYVSQKGKEGLHLPKINEIEKLLKILGEKADLEDLKTQIAMLMYLTNMDGAYWLYGSGDWRCCLECNVNKNNRKLKSYDNDSRWNFHSAGLCMINYELDDIGTIVQNIKEGENREISQNLLQRFSNKNTTFISELKEVSEYKEKIGLLDKTIKEAKDNLGKLKEVNLNLGDSSMVLENLEGYIKCLEECKSGVKKEESYQHQRAALSTQKKYNLFTLEGLNKSYDKLSIFDFGERKKNRDESKKISDEIDSIDVSDKQLSLKINALPGLSHYESQLNDFRN